ncbi:MULTISPECIES: hypothetical protein [Streptomyces]|uniref:Uncharacterized protein n=1 Tax=Streptomyces yanii TaxID=78510 RepID=A0ABV5RK05_9ACTN
MAGFVHGAAGVDPVDCRIRYGWMGQVFRAHEVSEAGHVRGNLVLLR